MLGKYQPLRWLNSKKYSPLLPFFLHYTVMFESIKELNLTKIQPLQIQYAAAIIYGPCIWSIKVTLLLILVRVFTPFRRIISAVWAFIFAMLLYYIIVTALKVFKCRPISSVWDPNTPGKCLNEILLFSIDTSLSIITDLIILILPIPL